MAATAADDPEPLMHTRFTPGRPPMLLTRQIPHKTGMLAMLQQRHLLGGRGRKPKPHATTLKNTTDNPRRERRFHPGLKAGIFTPRKR
jgi:hypothetical protein